MATRKSRKTENLQKNDISTAKRWTALPESFREATQATADREAFAKLCDAYGADEKPCAPNQRRQPHVKHLYSQLKWRIVHRILDEAGYTGRRNLIPLNFYAKEEAIMPTEEKPSTTKPEAKDTRKHDYVETPHGEFRKDSVLHIIYRGLARAGGATKAELAEMLEEKHPTSKGETPWAEKSTINCQIDRMPDERGFTLARTAKGKYGIEPKGEHKFSGLTGWDKTRVLSPEQAKAKAEKEAAKAEKEKAKAKEKAEKEAAKAKAKEAEEKAKATAKAEADKKQAAADAKAQAEKAKADKLK